MLSHAGLLLVKFWRPLYILLCSLKFFNLLDVLYSWQPHPQSIFVLHIALYNFFMIFWSPYFFPATTLILFKALFALALNLLICSSQFNLLFSVILKNYVLSLEGIILFFIMISIGSSFLFLNFFSIDYVIRFLEKFLLNWSRIFIFQLLFFFVS